MIRGIPIALGVAMALMVASGLLAWRYSVQSDEAGALSLQSREAIESMLLPKPGQDSAIAAERTLLSRRRQLRLDTLAKTKWAMLVTASTAVLVGCLSLWQIQREAQRRRQIERGLHETAKFLDSIVEHIPNMIFVKEARGLRFERFNRAGEELLGVKREDLIGKNDYDFFPHDEAVFFQAKDRQALENGSVVDIAEEPIDTRAGRRWLHTRKVPIMGADGRPAFLLGISEDITERKRQAEALRQAIDEAQTANRELEAFSYSVAHDLRAPLRGIDGFSLALLEDYGDKIDEQGKGYIARVRGAAQRMGELIDDLLTLSRVTRQPIVREEVDLTALAHSIIEDMSTPGRTVVWKVFERLHAQGDASLLRVLLENLFSNAVKFTGQRAHASIEFGRDREGFYVRDNGAGFDMQHVDKLFGVFQRLHTTVEFAGTGIGLVSTQRIVQRHGGKIWAEGAVGSGATFHFTLGAS